MSKAFRRSASEAEAGTRMRRMHGPVTWRR